MISSSAMLAALVGAAAVAGADLTVTMTVADGQDDGVFPYRMASLTVENASRESVEHIRVRPRGGGPAVRYRLAVPPGGKGKLQAALPALAPVQDYEVVALDGAGRDIAGAASSITWPAALVTTDAFIDDAYAHWRDESATWPKRCRWHVLLVLTGFGGAVAAAVLFVRNGLVRAAIVCLATGAAVLACMHLLQGPGAAQAAEYHLVLHLPGQPSTQAAADDGGRAASGNVESFVVLSARRTTEISLCTSGVPYPVYADRSAADDEAVVDPVDKTIGLILRPGEVRVIRPGRRKVRLPTAPCSGTVRRTGPRGERMIVEADLMHQRAVIVRNDSVWNVPPGFGRLRLTVSERESQPVWGLIAEPRLWRLNTEEARLFAYWRHKRRRANETYLISFAGGGAGIDEDVCRIDVLEAEPTTPADE